MALAFTQYANTVTLSPNNTSVNADLPAGADNVLVTNTSANVIFVRVQRVTGAVAASATDTPLLGGQAAILDVPTVADVRVSVFCASTATVYVTPGVGGL